MTLLRCIVSLPFFLIVLANSLFAQIDFARDVRPILSEKCFKCHGPDAATREADLRLDIEGDNHKPRDGYHILKAGAPDDSELIKRLVTTDTDKLMPPPDSKMELKPAEIEILKKWIAQGGKWSQHWSFTPPHKPALPKVTQTKWPKNEIDFFVLEKMERNQLRPMPVADKATLLRRASLDLTGLLPSPAEIQKFVEDDSPNAWEHAIDRLLASERYGEHMAKAWLDAARYADTNGYQYDTERTQWPWRDWVINAFNQNKKFDEFTIEQLAGDLLPNATQDQIIATGFNRNHGITIEGGVIDEEYRTEYVMDRVVTTSEVWMGLTMVCARCHNHKYDPFTQREFYQIFAFFNQVPERGNNGFDPQIPYQSSDMPKLEGELTDLKQKLSTHIQMSASEIAAWEETLRGSKEKKASLWETPNIEKAVTTSGAKLEHQSDGSYLVVGDAPGNDEYTFVWPSTGTTIGAIKLEALTHQSLPHNGPGRAFNSNYVLSETILEHRVDGTDEWKGIKFAKATADYSQSGFEIGNTIDGSTGSGWAVDGPTNKENRVATFHLEKPFTSEKKGEFRLRLVFAYGSAHAIGRPRIQVSSQIDADWRTNIFDLIAIPREKRSPDQQEQINEAFVLNSPINGELRGTYNRVQELGKEIQKRKASPVNVLVMKDMAEVRKTFVLERGQYDKPKDEVSFGVIESLAPWQESYPKNRLGFARWLVSQEHPLTARVTVNRFWQSLFGVGLVKTAEDFGLQGELPSHPELLDHLAIWFMDNGWDVKQLHKYILMSATYQQSAAASKENFERDPENRLLARGPSGRLPAEVIRDNALLASGLLVERVGGPSVYPYHPPGLWTEINNRPGYSKEYEQGTGDQLYRRSLYSFWKRTVPPPSLQSFDAPEREFCVLRRSVTNTPLQAFVLLHDPQFVEAARVMAERAMLAHPQKLDDQLRFVFLWMNSRQPNEKELAILNDLYQKRMESYSADSAKAKELLQTGERPVDTSLDQAQLASLASVVRVVFNLSESISKN